ncbi:hypothetical protein JXA31_09460 [Candidatus Bathyarchaeota archaeon]|nr:hypothetical protein [Candidatus Bathyarchaeota archaeon]
MNKKSPQSAFFSLILLSMLLFHLLPVIAGSALSWNIQTVDESAHTYQSRCPIALDSKGLPHIAYNDLRVEPNRRQTGLVMYANWNGTNWKTQQIAKGITLSLVLDDNDQPHILYKGSLEPLMYASWTGSEWDIQIVDPNFTSYGSGVVALDSQGNPHVAYTDGITVKYAVLNGEEWTVQTVAQYEDVEIPPKLSFVLDKNDTPYIMHSPSSYVYFPQDVGIQAINVTLATYQNSSWKIQPLSLPPPTGEYGSLVVDSKGGLHSIFTKHHYVSSESKTVLSTILYASWNGTGWDMQTVVSDIRLPYSMSLALDSRDYPHIICSSNEPVYASWTGTAWDMQATDVSGYLAVDADGNLHVSYLAGSPMVVTSLMYATATPPTPTPTPYSEPQSTEQEIIIGVALVLAVIALGLGLLLYLIKRK